MPVVQFIMSRRIARGRILKVDLDGPADQPLHRRISIGIRRDILEGLLAPGMDLPSTRRLAEDLGVSRGTVVVAYEELKAEGYLRADVGGGTRVCASIPDACLRAIPDAPAVIGVPSRRASHRGTRLAAELDAVPVDLGMTGPRAFRSSPAAIDVFPVDTWTRIATRQWRRATTRDLSYGQPLGFLPLRRAVADYVAATRGVRCTADQVIVVSGAQQAMDVAARALLDPGDAVWMEDPGYFGIRGALVAAGASVIPVGVDEEGIDVAEGRRVAPRARMAAVTPSHQVPLGVQMSAARRRALTDWASDADAWILEDDYNSDFHYSSRPPAPLRASDRSDRVIYCGTFNKSLVPGLRIGFLIAPDSVREAIVATRFFSDIQQSYIDQATLAEFITTGQYERHIRRLRQVYQVRRDLLLAGLEGCGTWLSTDRYDSGRELTVRLRGTLDDVLLAQAADRAGISVSPLTPWAISHRPHPGLRLGYSGIDEPDIEAGVRTLRAVLEACAPGGVPRSPTLEIAS